MWGGNMKVFMINNDGYDGNIIWPSEWCLQTFTEKKNSRYFLVIRKTPIFLKNKFLIGHFEKKSNQQCPF